jgi:hypothetical protein
VRVCAARTKQESEDDEQHQQRYRHREPVRALRMCEEPDALVVCALDPLEVEQLTDCFVYLVKLLGPAAGDPPGFDQILRLPP